MQTAEQAERVIFRREYNEYQKSWDYMAVFPDDEANPGRVVAVIFYFDSYGKAWFYTDEVDISYLHSNRTRIIHKNDAEIPMLLEAVKSMFGGEYKVCEKIIYNRRKTGVNS